MMGNVKLLILMCTVGMTYSQMSPFRQLQMANMLQRRNSLLQQSMLQNLRNPATTIGARPSMEQSVQLIDRLNQMTQNMMSNVNPAPATPVPSTGGNSFVPVDVLLRQQRNLQAQMLQNLRNMQNANMNVPTVQTVGLNRNQNLNTQGQQTQPQQNTNANDVTVVVIRRNDTTAQTIPDTSGPQTADVNPFATSMGNISFDDIFTNFGELGFPSTSADFWTGSTNTIGSPGTSQTPDATSGTLSPRDSRLFTNTNVQQPTSRQTTFDPATGITFGSGFIPGQQPTSRTNEQNTGTTFGSGTGSTTGSSFWTGQETTVTDSRVPGTETTSNQNTSPSLTGINLPGGFSSGLSTSVDTTVTTGVQPTAIVPDALSCSEEYRKIPEHTLCMTDSPLLTRAGLDIDDRLRITQIHNSLRANVQPPATDLVAVQWDDRIAAVAQKWAKQCRLAHDTERKIPEMGMSFGQNVAVGFETWQEAIQMWYDEVSLYRYGLEPDSYLGTDGWRQVAHFTQIVQNGTFLIGCGYAECPSTQYIRYYVCNYAAGQTDLAYPYTAGLRCESCPNNCINGLCDCGGLVCYNGGTLDLNTCKCECPKPYTGQRCEIVDCPVNDNWICGRDWPPSYCDRFYNVPEECPYMCGICGDGSTSGSGVLTTTPNVTTFTSAYGCRYTGKRDDSASCRNYGDNGSDMRMCATQGGTVGCGECDRFFNIKRDYCPVMCGLCDPPCAGKRCSNGGTLDTNTCSCSCRKPFTGDTCEFAQCPINGDPGFCRFWPPRYCQMYYNVPEECPYMCGICKMDNPTVSVRGDSKRPADFENPLINTRGRPKRIGDSSETKKRR